ncbi:hypothetical protein E2562_025867 [Oryza meyeriana var. granulata]|uniref:Uncharacterized protein n=1 Tax=Oryza meyeriana var. granulata TaxID=110450 RepID=A0A6G1C0L8_9ORYZ|nr:hypothetical protein E2562_025867 [Oryza meyeriana var. granulata]
MTAAGTAANMDVGPKIVGNLGTSNYTLPVKTMMGLLFSWLSSTPCEILLKEPRAQVYLGADDANHDDG